MGNLPCLERGNFLRNHDHVSVSVRYTDGFRQFAGQPCAIGDFSCISAGRLMDIVEMPQEDYSADREVEQFAEKIPGKRHRACYGGLELYLP